MEAGNPSGQTGLLLSVAVTLCTSSAQAHLPDLSTVACALASHTSAGLWLELLSLQDNAEVLQRST